VQVYNQDLDKWEEWHGYREAPDLLALYRSHYGFGKKENLQVLLLFCLNQKIYKSSRVKRERERGRAVREQKKEETKDEEEL
jgi:hypothetical protein